MSQIRNVLLSILAFVMAPTAARRSVAIQRRIHGTVIGHRIQGTPVPAPLRVAVLARR